MPTLQQAQAALRNAEAAGDTESARIIRQAIRAAEAPTDSYDQRVARRAEEIRRRAGTYLHLYLRPEKPAYLRTLPLDSVQVPLV